ncbi:MAG: type II toxin-antitoxin system PemK/MazF family toxin [Planctomycetes bacterium]|nr:type II toxin-antitoxin system PemK/MazF family toxin [Planctomycetota bacterium]
MSRVREAPIAPAVRRRGEIWFADLDPIVGREQAGRRPVLIISDDTFSNGPADLVIVCPMTSTLRPIRSFVVIAPPEGGVTVPSAIMCHQVRTISVKRLIERWGAVSGATQQKVSDIVRILIP